MEVFSKRLREERKAAGLSQRELAEKLGISQSTYKGYEFMGTSTGRQPSLEIVCKIAEVLGVSVDYLLGLKEI